MGALAIMAGRGELPRLVAEAARAAGEPYLVVTFSEPAPDWVADHRHEPHRFEKAGRLFRALGRAGCDRVVFAGAMDRPRLDPLALDVKGVMLIARVLGLLRRGDDGLLRGLGAIFEAEGMRLVAPADCLGESDLTLAPGVPTRAAPDARARADAGRAAEILRALRGRIDAGRLRERKGQEAPAPWQP